MGTTEETPNLVVVTMVATKVVTKEVTKEVTKAVTTVEATVETSITEVTVKNHKYPTNTHKFPIKNHKFLTNTHKCQTKNHKYQINTHKFPTKNLRYLTKNPRSQTRSCKPEPAQQVQEVLEVADTEALVEVPPEVLLEVLQLVKETTVSKDNRIISLEELKQDNKVEIP